MAVVVVGGHSRNIGKTSVAEGLIRALPDAGWTALKITHHRHDFPGDEQAYVLSEERAANSTDSGRFLAAGARRSYWLRTPEGQLGGAAAEIHRIIGESRNMMIESNSVMELLHPDLYLFVLDGSVGDMKQSARHWLPQADALIVLRGMEDHAWPGVQPSGLAAKPRFQVDPAVFITPELVAFVAAKLSGNS